MIYSVTVTCPESGHDDLITLLWELGTTGVTQDRDWLRAFFDEDAISHEIVLARLAGLDVRLETSAGEENWSEDWKRLWQPFAVGRRLYLTPPWHLQQPPEGRLRIQLRPGMACGSGLHPCTRLCLELMEAEPLTARALLDVGTGSGILAEAARVLGAHPVFACDIDPEATPIAARNLAESGLPHHCFTGSLRSIRSRSVPFVVANLNAASLRAIASEFRRVCFGVLILSGFREEELASVVHAVGLPLRSQSELEGWCGAVLKGV